MPAAALSLNFADAVISNTEWVREKGEKNKTRFALVQQLRFSPYVGILTCQFNHFFRKHVLIVVIIIVTDAVSIIIVLTPWTTVIPIRPPCSGTEDEDRSLNSPSPWRKAGAMSFGSTPVLHILTQIFSKMKQQVLVQVEEQIIGNLHWAPEFCQVCAKPGEPYQMLQGSLVSKLSQHQCCKKFSHLKSLSIPEAELKSLTTVPLWPLLLRATEKFGCYGT